MAGLGREKGNILKVINFCSPGETFHALKEKEEKQYGESYSGGTTAGGHPMLLLSRGKARKFHLL
jgi:hypothetical protein